MKRRAKNLFDELLFIEKNDNSNLNEMDDEEEVVDVEEDKSINDEDLSANISFVGSPVYPRIFWGDSAKPLMGQFPESEYVDDNIHRTYKGLLSYLG